MPATSGYWGGLHETSDDLAPVLYPSMPRIWNEFVDRIQRAAVEEALGDLVPGRSFEAGCGRGRWLARLRARGWRATGLDVAPAARPPILAQADRIPIRSGRFDLVLAITVLQHLPSAEQIAALEEMTRLLAPRGRIVLLEVIDRPGVAWQEHVFPRSAEGWRSAIRAAGLRIERDRPVEYLPLLRLLEGRRRAPGPPGGSAAGPRLSPFRRAAGAALTLASIPIEPLAARLAPEASTHRLYRAVRD